MCEQYFYKHFNFKAFHKRRHGQKTPRRGVCDRQSDFSHDVFCEQHLKAKLFKKFRLYR